MPRGVMALSHGYGADDGSEGQATAPASMHRVHESGPEWPLVVASVVVSVLAVAGAEAFAAAVPALGRWYGVAPWSRW